MVTIAHAQRSASKYGGAIGDYSDIHAFIDSTQAYCNDNRHHPYLS